MSVHLEVFTDMNQWGSRVGIQTLFWVWADCQICFEDILTAPFLNIKAMDLKTKWWLPNTGQTLNATRE